MKIFISKQNLNCSDVLTFFYNMKIETNNTENRTTNIDNNKVINIENGCNIRILNDKDKKNIIQIWDKLNNQFKLKCAHISTENYKGCILDYINNN